MGSQPVFSPKERLDMNKVTPRKGTMIAVLLLLALLTVLVVKRGGVTAEEAQDEAVRTAVKLGDSVIHHEYPMITFLAFLALMAFFAFVIWTALRAHEGEDEAIPPAKESSASRDSHAGASRPEP
jgi:hypothetical protein